MIGRPPAMIGRVTGGNRAVRRSWLTQLRDDDIVLIDGGTGGELKRRGVRMSPHAWSGLAARDHEPVLRQIHADFIRAGADVITTNTFGSTRFVLASAGLADEFATINRRAVGAALAAREDAERPIAIAGSMSCLPPRFDRRAYPPPETEREAYRELAMLLAESGVDLIALEMIQDAAHGKLALAAALETGLPVWLGLSARRGDDGLLAYDDPQTPLEPVLEALLAQTPTVVNVMHTPVDMIDAGLACVRRHWDGPLGAYPELGDPFAPAAGPDALVERAARWVAGGARLLGGCCGAGPEHIAALAAARGRLAAARQAAGPPRTTL